MSSSSGLTKILALSAVALASWLMLASPATAQPVARSFYQNAGASCHGINSLNEARLQRSSGRLQNTSSTTSADVVCNLMTDAFAVADGNGVVTGAWIWARRIQIRGDNVSMTCTLSTSYAGDANGQSETKTITFPSSYGQAVASFTPSSGKYLAPVNVRCILPPKTELNDWLLMYEEEVAPV